MNILFAKWEAFWLEARWIWMFILTHEIYPDCNEQYESYWPCSDKPQFFPPMIMDDEGVGRET